MITHVEDKNKFKNQESIFKQQSEQMLRNAQLQVREHTMLGRNETEYYGGMLSRELEAQNDFAMEHARNSQKDIEAESKKSRDKRRKQYEENRIQHGSNVTMETAAMQRNIVRHRKDWKKEQKKLETNSEKDIKKAAGTVNVSTNLFDITMIKGSRQHIDIKRIMHACNLLEWFQKNSGQIDRLPIDQRVKINAGIAALPRLLDARNALLASHALNENGAISQRAQGDEGESSNIGIAEMIQEQRMLTHTATVEQAVNAYKQALQEGFAQQRQNLNTELQLGGELKNELDEKVREKRAQRSREWNQWEQDNMRYIVAYQGAGKTGELFYDTLNWKKELDERTVLIEAKRELLSRKEQERDTGGAEKLRALILMDEQSADYQEALHQSNRMMRMFKGVFEGKPLTTAMRLELARNYQFAQFEVGTLQNESPENITAAVERAKLQRRHFTDSERKEKGRREKRADRLQSYLGARSIASLSASELKKYGVDRQTVANMEDRRINLMQLEKWLAQDGEMKALKDALRMENEQEAEEKNGWDYAEKVENIGSSAVAVLDKAFLMIETEERFRLSKEAFEESEIMEKVGNIGNITYGIGDILTFMSTAQNIRKWKELSTEDQIDTVGDALSAVGDLTRTGFETFGSAEIADKIFAGTDAVSGVFGMVTSAMRLGNSNKRRLRTKEQMNIFDEENELFDQKLKADLIRLRTMLGAANKTASIEMADNITNFTTNMLKTLVATGRFFTLGIAELADAPVKLLSALAETISGKVVSARKASLRRKYVTDHFGEMIGRIKKENAEGNHFANLSDRDIKHTFLKFLGAKSGKRSEAGIRKMAVDSSYLIENTVDSDLKQYKKDTLTAMGLEENAKRSEVMQAMGATEAQAENPIIESNRIYRDQIRRGKDFKEGWFGRAWRKTKRWLKG